jgi:hypothetical protein
MQFAGGLRLGTLPVVRIICSAGAAISQGGCLLRTPRPTGQAYVISDLVRALWSVNLVVILHRLRSEGLGGDNFTMQSSCNTLLNITPRYFT